MCAHRINYYILKIARKVRFILLFGDYYVISAKSKHPAICIMEIPQGLVIMNTGLANSKYLNYLTRRSFLETSYSSLPRFKIKKHNNVCHMSDDAHI